MIKENQRWGTLFLFLFFGFNQHHALADLYRLEDREKHHSTGARLYDEVLSQTHSKSKDPLRTPYFERLRTDLHDLHPTDDQLIRLLISMNDDKDPANIIDDSSEPPTLVSFENIRDKIRFHLTKLKVIRTGCEEQKTSFPELHSFLDQIQNKVIRTWEWNKIEKLTLPIKDFSSKKPIEMAKAAKNLNLSPEQLKSIFPDAKFFDFLNQVGNYKNVVLVQKQDKKEAILKPIRDPKYISRYNEIKKGEKRPDIVFHALLQDEKEDAAKDPYFLAEIDYMGTERINWTNNDQIHQLVQLGLATAQRKTAFDPNPGNLVVHDGKLYYIDKDLNYDNSQTIVMSLVINIHNSFPKDNPQQLEYQSICKNIISIYQKELSKMNPAFIDQIRKEWGQNQDELKEKIEIIERWNKPCGRIYDDIVSLITHL